MQASRLIISDLGPQFMRARPAGATLARAFRCLNAIARSAWHLLNAIVP
ncbi:MAG: hypothetical protein AB7N65_26150 [Vicinamibacterales bacterium]